VKNALLIIPTVVLVMLGVAGVAYADTGNSASAVLLSTAHKGAHGHGKGEEGRGAQSKASPFGEEVPQSQSSPRHVIPSHPPK
jgi:hypothetical protein